MKFAKLALVLLVGPSLALVSCRAQREEGSERMEMAAASDVEAATAALDEVRTAFVDAFKAGDASKLASLFDESGFRLAPNVPMEKGRAAIEEGLKTAFEGTTARNLTLNGVDRGIGGDLAYEIGTYQVELDRASGARVEDRGKYIVLLKREADGGWKVHAQMFNSDLPAE